MPEAPRHKVFISFHHEDQQYKDEFVQMMGDDIVDESVDDGDIDDENLRTETIRQKIRDDFIRDATVTVVLIGPCTWQRKHVDWEIGSSLRKTEKNSRCGLLGILLPNHPDYEEKKYNSRLVPPKLADNVSNASADGPYAIVYNWSTDSSRVRGWIHNRVRAPGRYSAQQRSSAVQEKQIRPLCPRLAIGPPIRKPT